MKSLFDWHTLYALCINIQHNLEPSVCITIDIRVGVSDGHSARTRPLAEVVYCCLGAKAVGHS